MLGRSTRKLSLVPREQRLYDLFEQQAAMLVESAILLEQAFVDGADLEAFRRKIKAVEHQGTMSPTRTTQVGSGSVMGAGATRRLSAVRWGVAWRIVWAWIFTITAAALAALAALILEAGLAAIVVSLLILGAAASSLLILPSIRGRLWGQRTARQPVLTTKRRSLTASHRSRFSRNDHHG